MYTLAAGRARAIAAFAVGWLTLTKGANLPAERARMLTQRAIQRENPCIYSRRARRESQATSSAITVTVIQKNV